MTSRGAIPSFAVVVRTFTWDGFIARQVARYAKAAQGGDLFVSVDETRGPVGPVQSYRTFSTKDDDLIALGLPNRFAKGSLVWWNNDYPYYAFQRHFPDYEYYVFVEYDSVVQRDLAPMLADIATRGIDFVAEPIAAPLDHWFWWLHTRQAYGAGEIRASLNCIAIFSRRALHLLFARRLEMARDSRLAHWPISEAFVATEITRAGYAFAPLSAFGGTRDYDTFPPVLERELGASPDSVFVHPVLDEPRYLASLLRHGRRARDYIDKTSLLRRKLSYLPPAAYQALLARAAWRRFWTLRRERLERDFLRLKLALFQ